MDTVKGPWPTYYILYIIVYNLLIIIIIRRYLTSDSEVLFDIRVIDTDAQSYLTTAPNLVLFRAEGEKKQKYSAAATARRAHFTPLCFSVDGLTGSEAICFLRRLAGGLSSRWDRTYPEVLCWIRTRLAFAILRATGLCVRGLVPSGGALVWRMVRPLII